MIKALTKMGQFFFNYNYLTLPESTTQILLHPLSTDIRKHCHHAQVGSWNPLPSDFVFYCFINHLKFLLCLKRKAGSKYNQPYAYNNIVLDRLSLRTSDLALRASRELYN